MRRYDDPVEVRRGRLAGTAGAAGSVGVLGDSDGPEQFLWHGQLWQVRDVVASWIETGAWWRSGTVDDVLGVGHESESANRSGAGLRPAPDLLAERECWRVAAGRGALGEIGVFDLVFDWSQGDWRLVACHD